MKLKDNSDINRKIVYFYIFEVIFYTLDTLMVYSTRSIHNVLKNEFCMGDHFVTLLSPCSVNAFDLFMWLPSELFIRSRVHETKRYLVQD